ncbi:MAG: hypothetical protein KAY46_04630 [Burkholderiaceae bacterium]|nr:hypothetical protein [Burkholderiaceae bacterium]
MPALYSAASWQSRTEPRNSSPRSDVTGADYARGFHLPDSNGVERSLAA